MSDTAVEAARKTVEDTLEKWPRLIQKRCDEFEWLDLCDLFTQAIAAHTEAALKDKEAYIEDFRRSLMRISDENISLRTRLAAAEEDTRILQRLYDSVRETEDVLFGVKDRPPGSTANVARWLIRQRDALKEQLNRDPLRAQEMSELYRKLAAAEKERDMLLNSAAQEDVYCLVHLHSNRVEEAICSLRFQRDALKARALRHDSR
jgi:hypothetical protein